MDLICPSCPAGGTPVRKTTAAGQVFLGLGVLAILGAFGTHPPSGIVATIVGYLLISWFMRNHGSEVRCGKCGTLGVERLALVAELRKERDAEIVRITKERSDTRSLEKRRDALVLELGKTLAGRVLWVRLSEDDESVVRVGTDVPAKQMEPILLARGAMTIAREGRFTAFLVHGSMSRVEYDRLQTESVEAYEADDKRRGDIAEHAIRAMEERDMCVVRLLRL